MRTSARAGAAAIAVTRTANRKRRTKNLVCRSSILTTFVTCKAAEMQHTRLVFDQRHRCRAEFGGLGEGLGEAPRRAGPERDEQDGLGGARAIGTRHLVVVRRRGSRPPDIERHLRVAEVIEKLGGRFPGIEEKRPVAILVELGA